MSYPNPNVYRLAAKQLHQGRFDRASDAIYNAAGWLHRRGGSTFVKTFYAAQYVAMFDENAAGVVGQTVARAVGASPDFSNRYIIEDCIVNDEQQRADRVLSLLLMAAVVEAGND